VILIVSWPGDDHARAVLAQLAELDAPTALVDLARFPTEIGLAARFERGRWRYRLDDLSLGDVDVVWWRRPRPFALHPEIAEGEYARFAYGECIEAFAGLWQSLDAQWINHPTAEQVAAHKLYQLRVAAEVGLEIPRTLITNDPVEVQRFVDDHGARGVAYKTFLPAEHDWRETRILGAGELRELAAVRYAPVIFQEYVALTLDLRITVIGPEIIAAAVHPRAGGYEADYRMDLESARVEPFALPREVARRIEELMRRLGLVYGAIDMRRTPDGRFVFLEINPSGEWRFIEERSGQAITAAFAARLAGLADGGDRRPAEALDPYAAAPH
jgi:glutathione synthase/RimK-type ligase-like ATP-grasp enzyme